MVFGGVLCFFLRVSWYFSGFWWFLVFFFLGVSWLSVFFSDGFSHWHPRFGDVCQLFSKGFLGVHLGAKV